MQLYLVYVTVGGIVEARQIAHEVVRDGLAACANMVERIGSIYRWEGTIEEADETLLLFKTSEGRLQALIDRVRTLHSYELPAITAIPLAAGNPAYLDWIAAETSDPR
jgi:periplasmic divalent cation tolerance protein